MTDPSKKNDNELAKHFTQLRQREQSETPVFPRESALRTKEAIYAKETSFSDYLPRIAAGFVLIAIISIFTTNKPEEDPAAIYAGIMRNHESMATDHLLVVSKSLLPSMTTVPRFYDTDLEFEPELYAN